MALLVSGVILTVLPWGSPRGVPTEQVLDQLISQDPDYDGIRRSEPGYRQYSLRQEGVMIVSFHGPYKNPIQTWSALQGIAFEGPNGPEVSEFSVVNGVAGSEVVGDFCKDGQCDTWAIYSSFDDVVLYASYVTSPERTSADEAAQRVCSTWRALELVQECDDLEFVSK
ncbi:hypothetical protein [Naumannella halotolerans]|uniref:hypothetical protein n=1 Tax=Naumannella halotolerans TaxID=993414 RepID=UPI0010616CB5|nr:hypothetical protein [Naumannella halotolerans]